MPIIKQTPLAWKNLTHDWRRLAVAVAGIAFAVLLMFMQVGFQNGLFNSQVKLIDELQGDLFIVSKAKYTLAAEKRFPINRLHQASSCRGVDGAYPLYTELTTSVLKDLSKRRRGKAYPIRSIGFVLGDPIFRLPAILEQQAKLARPNVAMIDLRSKISYFPFSMSGHAELATSSVELASQPIDLVGRFDLGTDFAHDGNLVMSADNFAFYFPDRNRFGDPLGVVDLGIVHLAPGADAEAVTRQLNMILDGDVSVFSRAAFRAKEIRFWDNNTPIGIVFNAGKVIGFIVGMVICYQVIYSDIADHMPEYATLMAMGYPHCYFVRLIFNESIMLSLFGFLPGLIASRLLYGRLAQTTGLSMQMPPSCWLMVLLLTVVMCIASGLLAVRKLLSADPASLF